MKNEKSNLREFYNGDEKMENMRVTYPALDLIGLIGSGAVISSQEALQDVAPVPWSEDVLKGNYRGKNLIKSKDKEE